MEKVMKVFLIILLVTTLVACSCSKSEKSPKNKDNNQKQEEKKEEPVKDITEKKQGDIEFEDIKIEYRGAMNIVSAKVINNSSKTVNFKAVMYMKNGFGRTLGKVDQTIKNLKSGETTDISIEIMGDYRTVETFEVKIEDLVEL
jgi:hypothetical protein